MASKLCWLSPENIGKAIGQESWFSKRASSKGCLGFLISWSWSIREEVDFLMSRHESPRMSPLLHPVDQSSHRSSPSSKGGNLSSISWWKEKHAHMGRDRYLWSSLEINHMHVPRTEIFTKRNTISGWEKMHQEDGIPGMCWEGWVMEQYLPIASLWNN